MEQNEAYKMTCPESGARKCPIKSVLVIVLGGSDIGGIIVEMSMWKFTLIVVTDRLTDVDPLLKYILNLSL